MLVMPMVPTSYAAINVTMLRLSGSADSGDGFNTVARTERAANGAARTSLPLLRLGLELDAHVWHGWAVFAKLLIATLFVCGLLLLWAAAAILGWGIVLSLCVVGAPVCWLAHAKPARWGWLIGLRCQPPPKPVGPAAMGGDPSFDLAAGRPLHV